MFIFLGYSHYSLVSTYQSHYEQTMIYIHYHWNGTQHAATTHSLSCTNPVESDLHKITITLHWLKYSGLMATITDKFNFRMTCLLTFTRGWAPRPFSISFTSASAVSIAENVVPIAGVVGCWSNRGVSELHSTTHWIIQAATVNNCKYKQKGCSLY